jgi:transposase-like protein
MVEETFEPGMTVSLVARRHGVAANQLFTWRRLVAQGRVGAPRQAGLFLFSRALGDRDGASRPAAATTGGDARPQGATHEARTVTNAVRGLARAMTGNAVALPPVRRMAIHAGNKKPPGGRAKLKWGRQASTVRRRATAPPISATIFAPL